MDSLVELLKLLLDLLKSHGVLGLLSLTEGIVIWYLYSQNKGLIDKLLALSEKRLEDLQRDNDNYEKLAHNFSDHIEILIKFLQKRNGNGNGNGHV